MAKFRSLFDGEVRKVTVTCSQEEKLTKGSFKDECDINKVMARYKRTGQLPALATQNPQYGDFSSVPDFMQACEIVKNAEIAFAALPAKVRKECQNDPVVFLELVKDPKWRKEHELCLPPSGMVSEPSKGIQEAPKGAAATQPGGESLSASGVKSSSKGD